MIPDVSKATFLGLEAHPKSFMWHPPWHERETLKSYPDGHLAATGHPVELGKSLTHKWITTDFAESLLEFITPV